MSPLTIIFSALTRALMTNFPHEFPLTVIFLAIAGVRTFQEWIKYRYGVFAESGFANDPMYPEQYALGPQWLKNEGCNTTWRMSEAAEEKYNNSTYITANRQMVSQQLIVSK